jgi:hypothetical protein
MIETGRVSIFGFAEGVGTVTADNPRINYTGDPYFTDGFRLVLFMGGGGKRTDEVRMIEWGRPRMATDESSEVRE